MAVELAKVQKALGDRFEVVREIDRGGMAVVFLAHDLKHGRDVAVKVLREELQGSVHSERFLQEVRLEGRLQHPHILPVFESGSAEGILYFITPFVAGESLRARIDREGMLPVGDALRIGQEIADALAHSHATGVVHRDIKPSNILLREGHALVADFGVAKALEESAGRVLTQTGMVVGTPAYMSPEQAGGGSNLDQRTDLYSLGCVLYEMLGGEPPFTGPTTQSVLAKHLNEPPPSLRTIRPDLPPGLVKLVRRLLAKVPADRYQAAEKVSEALGDPRILEQAPKKTFNEWVLSGGWFRVLAATVVVVAAGLLVTKGLGWWPQGSGPELDPNKVAVFPLADRSGLSPDGGGIDVLIGMALEQTEPLLFRPAFDWLTPEQRADAGTITHQEGQRISRNLGAASFITGQILRRPDSVSVALTLHEVENGRDAHQAYGSAPLGGQAVEEAGKQAIVNLLPSLVDPERVMELEPFQELNPSAIASWIQGEREYRFSRFESALGFYERALREDSLLTFAGVKGAQAANWSHNEGDAPRLIQAALRPGAPLPIRYRHFLEALLAYAQGRAGTAEVELRGALEEDPEWSEAWMLLAEVHNHLLPKDVSPDSAEAFFLEAAKDPGFTPPLIHLAEKAIREGRLQEAEGFIQRLEQNDADPDKLSILHTMYQCVSEGPESVDFFALAEGHLETAYDLAVLLSGGARQGRCARAGFESILAVDAWSSNYSWASAQILQRLMVAQGEVEEAESFLLSLIENERASAAPMFTAVLDAAAGAPMPRVLSITEETAKGIYGENYEEIRGVLTPWVLGTLYVTKNEPGPVRAMRDHLAGLGGETGEPLTRLLAECLSAQLELMEGDTATALSLFESLTPVSNRYEIANGLPDALAPERLKLAELYLAAGDFARAHQVASVFDHEEATVFIPFVPASLEIRRAAAEGMGQEDLAQEYARRLRELPRRD